MGRVAKNGCKNSLMKQIIEVKNVGKRINRRLKSIVPIKEKTFHSFRKNFSQNIELNSKSEDKIKKYLMGHSQSKDITHAVYNRGES